MSFTVQGLAEVSQLATSSSWMRPNKKCFVEPVSSKVDKHLIFWSKGTISRIQNVRSTLVETISIVWREWKIDCLEWVLTSWPEWMIILRFKSQIEPTVVSNVTLNSGPWTSALFQMREARLFQLAPLPTAAVIMSKQTDSKYILMLSFKPLQSKRAWAERLLCRPDQQLI